MPYNNPAPVVLWPLSGTTIPTLTPTMIWSAVGIAANGYDLGIYHPGSINPFYHTTSIPAGSHTFAVPAGILQRNTLYYWKLKAIPFPGDTATSTAALSFTTGLFPDPPIQNSPIGTSSVPSIVTTNLVNLQWTPTVPVGPSYYYHIVVEQFVGGVWNTLAPIIDTESGLGSLIQGSSWAAALPASSGQYRWKIQASENHTATTVNTTPSYGTFTYPVPWGSFSGYQYFNVVLTTLPSPPVLDTPGTAGGYPGTSIATLTPQLKWQAVTGATSYRILLDKTTDGGATWTNLINTSVASPGLTYDVPGLTDGVKYRWTANVTTGAGTSPDAPPLYFYTQIPVVVVPAPVLVSPGISAGSPGTQVSTLTPTFSWNAVTSADNYHVFVEHWNDTTDEWDALYDAITGSVALTWTYPPIGTSGVPDLVEHDLYRWTASTHTAAGGWGAANSNPLYFNVIAYVFQADQELPAAGPMDYYMGRIWYATKDLRTYCAGDIVRGVWGTAPFRFRDSILHVTENPLATAGDGFQVPSNGGNINAITHPANLDAALGQGRLTLLCEKSLYQLTVPVDRSAWQSVDNDNAPLQTEVMTGSGTLAERSAVSHNGDLFYQGADNSVRSFSMAVRYFGTWGNLAISSNVDRALKRNDMSLMRFASSIVFDNRLLQTAMPISTVNGVAFQGILALDFDIISNLQEKKPPAWDGMYDGLNVLQLFRGSFGGKERAFAAVAEPDNSIAIYEFEPTEKTDTVVDARRITWYVETAAYTFGKEFELKKLDGGEIWIDRVSGTVDVEVYYRPDADVCWRFWHKDQFCSAADTSEDADNPIGQGQTGYSAHGEGYNFTLMLPKPPMVNCAVQSGRPLDQGYQFQAKIVLKGFCRIRGVIMYATAMERSPFSGLKG